MAIVAGMVRGFFAFVTTAILGGICIVFGFSPQDWVAAVITEPPAWLSHPLTRIGALALGAVLGWWSWRIFQAWRSTKTEAADQPELFYKQLRIPLIGLCEEAKNQGWDFVSPQSLHILDLMEGVTQAALDGTFKTWGRKIHSFDDLTKKERLVEIDKEHWKDYEVDPIACIKWDNTGNPMELADNFGTYSCKLGTKYQKFADIHLERSAALDWLANEAKSYMGRNQLRKRE